MKRNDLRRAGTRSTQRRPALPRSGTAGCPANPFPPPPHPPPGSRPQPRPPRGGARGPKWAQMDPKCAKGHFFTFGAQNAKKCSFCTFGAQSAKRCSFSHFDTKKSKIRCRNHWFHKHLRPGGKKDPKMHFGPKNAFWGPKRIFGPKNAFWAPFCPLAADAYETNGFCIGF